MSDEIIWLDQTEQLEALVERCLDLPVVALDTEFMRTDTFYPILALIQIYDGQTSYLIDPVALDDLSPLNALLQSESVVKVLHAPSEDLEIFTQLFGRSVKAIFDLQLAAAYCGHRVQMSLQALLETLAGIEVSKSESRSNWLARPLTSSQIEYAADDVKYLLPIYQALNQRLIENGRKLWLEHELAQLQANMLRSEASFDSYFYKLGAAGDFNQFKQYVLQQLCIWRETLTRQVDKPRSRVVPDKALLEICQLLPNHSSQLYDLEQLPQHLARKYGTDILDIVAQAKAESAPQFPALIAKPLNIAQGKVHKQLKALVKARAQKLGLEASLIFKRADYMALFSERDSAGVYHWPESICQWRSDLLKSDLLNYLNG